MSDVWAIIDGTHFELEMKSGSGVLSKPQKIWRNTCEQLGLIFIESRSVEQTINDIKKALAGKTRAKSEMKGKRNGITASRD